jgi:hypothetical protein
MAASVASLDRRDSAASWAAASFRFPVRYSSNHRSVVRELYGVMAAEGAAGGYVVTSGTFTKVRSVGIRWPRDGHGG